MKGYEAFPAEQCGICAHFQRHYIRLEDGCYSPLTYGHCVYPRQKKRRAEERCPHWSAIREAGKGEKPPRP